MKGDRITVHYPRPPGGLTITCNTLPKDIKAQECDATMLLWNTTDRTKILIIDQRSTINYPTPREAGFTTFQEGAPGIFNNADLIDMAIRLSANQYFVAGLY